MASTPHRSARTGPPSGVAVVIPARNEAERIGATVRAAAAIAGVRLVLVVDDGSDDATSRRALDAGAEVVRHPRNRGKGAAMQTGATAVASRTRTVSRRGDPGPDGAGPAGEQDGAAPDGAGPDGAGPAGEQDGGAPDGAAPDGDPLGLLFVDADLGATAANAAPLLAPILAGEADMAIAVLPPQATAGGGRGFVVRLSRRGVRDATGWTATQPLSGIRCLTREAFEAARPLAPGWGVETALTIDLLTAGYVVVEVPCDLAHRVTGSDWRGQLHRAGQYRDVVRALATRRLRRAAPLRVLRRLPLPRLR